MGFFRPEHARAMHLEQTSWIRERLTDEFEGPTILVTHHLPHPRSIHRKYRGSALNPAFASDLSHFMGPPIALWIHGHTHESCDYVENGTRVVCNPRGYGPFELNAAFDPILKVEINQPSPLQRAPGWIEPPESPEHDRIRNAEAA